MAKQIINIGSAPNGAGGDTPRSAWIKAGSNFDELYANDAQNVKKGVNNTNAAGTVLSSGGQPNIASISSSGNDRNGPLQIHNASNNAASAVLSFIREGVYGLHLGLDTDNQLKLGGWSMGNVAYKIWHAGNVVGTVGQSGGIPTGAIIENGSNANGRYTKFADGTLICRYTSGKFKTDGTFPYGYYSGAPAFTFPVAFVGIPEISHSAVDASGFFAWTAIEGNVSNTSFSARLVSGTSTTTACISYIAIGRWF